MTQIASMIDELGEIKAMIAQLKEQEDALTAAIKAEGTGEYEGLLFRVVVSEVAETQKLDPKKAEKKLRQLGVDNRWFSKNQKKTKGYVKATVYAKKS